MIFDRLKSALSGQQAGPSHRLSQALLPVSAVSHQLHARAVAFVHDGSNPEVLLELNTANAPDLDQLMMRPGQAKSWTHGLHIDLQKRLAAVGVTGEPPLAVPQARFAFYRDTSVSQPQFLRFGYLLAAVGNGPNRRVDGVPLWLTTLLNDLSGVTSRDAVRELQWPPERFADLLRHDHAPEADIPGTVLLAVSEREARSGGRMIQPHQLPGIDNYLLGFGHLIVPGVVSRLSVDGRTGIAERATANPAVARVLAPVLAQLAGDVAKAVRSAAVSVLPLLPDDVLVAVLRPVLQTLPTAQGGELIEYLSRTPFGGALLDEAVAAGARLGPAVARANARREALQAASADEPPLLVPPFTPFSDDLDHESAVRELRAFVDGEIERWVRVGTRHGVEKAKENRKLTDDDLRQVVACATGRRGGHPLADFNANVLGRAVPSFNLLHLLRLGAGQRNARVGYLVHTRIDDIDDLRQVEDALRRSWNTETAFDELPQLAMASRYWGAIEPVVSWPWFATRPDVLQGWLTGDASDVGDALTVLNAFPSLPPSLLPSVAAVAMSRSRRNRPVAQQLLARHGAARALAEQGLSDTVGELRAASAGWLADLGDADAVPALRAALAKEKREVPRAALLNALQDLGDDISADLAPERLLAEARAGLRGKRPAAMDWFGFERLPALAWRNGEAVDPLIPTWWVVLADKVKDPDGSGLLALYLGLLAPASGEAFGRFVLDSWIAHDVRHPLEQESRAYAAVAGQKWHSYAQDQLTRVRGRGPKGAEQLAWAEQRAALPLEHHIRAAYSDHQSTYLGSAAAHRGLLALTSRTAGIELADAVQAYIRKHGARRAQVDAQMYALFANGQPAAVQLLLSISRRFKQASVQATAAALVQRLADDRGWTADELADRTIPTAGFDPDALLRLDFGSRQFLGRATPAGTIALTTADGAPLKALPAARTADDAELVAQAKKQLTGSRKELKAVLTQQAARLYEAMCVGRTWRVADWNEFLRHHPLVGQLVSRLVWAADPGPRQVLFRPTEDGSLIDADDETVALAEGVRVGLAHRVTVGDEASETWLAHLADYEVSPLFDQFANGLPAVDRALTELSDLEGHLSDTFSFRGVATKRGYQRGSAEDGAWFTDYTKSFSAAGLTAVLEFTGSYVPEENLACATRSLGFRGTRYRMVSLSDVPDVLLAECYADYAALAALGPFDPDWEKKAGL